MSKCLKIATQKIGALPAFVFFAVAAFGGSVLADRTVDKYPPGALISPELLQVITRNMIQRPLPKIVLARVDSTCREQQIFDDLEIMHQSQIAAEARFNHLTKMSKDYDELVTRFNVEENNFNATNEVARRKAHAAAALKLLKELEARLEAFEQHLTNTKQAFESMVQLSSTLKCADHDLYQKLADIYYRQISELWGFFSTLRGNLASISSRVQGRLQGLADLEAGRLVHGCIRLYSSLPPSNEVARMHNPPCSSGPTTADQIIDLIDKAAKNTKYGQVTSAIAASDWARNRIKVLLGVHNGRSSCQIVCGTIPQKAGYRWMACVDGPSGDRCSELQSGAISYHDFDYWAFTQNVGDTQKDGLRLLCFQNKNWKHDLARTMVLQICF